MKNPLRWLVLLSLICWGVLRTYKAMAFDIHCGGHMLRAAQANSIPLAVQEMTTVVEYLRERGMTQGYTSIIYDTPGEDVGFYYENMRIALDGLKKVPANASSMESSSVLIKLKETTTHPEGESGRPAATHPFGISIFPHNLACCAWFIGSVLLFLPTLVERKRKT